LAILAAAVIFTAAEPVLSARAAAMTENEMERILEDEGDIRDSSGWQDISDVPGLGSITEIIDAVIDAFGDITSGEFYIDDILTGMLGHAASMFTMIPQAIAGMVTHIPDALVKVVSTIGDAIVKLVELALNPFKDVEGWIDDMIGRIGVVSLGNAPLETLLTGGTDSVLVERLLGKPGALRVELGPLIDNFLIAEVIWLASKYVAGSLASSLGAWWADCVAMLAIDAEDVGIAFIKFEELGLFENWDGDIRDNYARDHEALASGKKVPLSMPGKIGGLYGGLSASGAFSFAANPESALRGAYGGYRAARPEELYIDDYKDGTKSALDYARGLADAAGAEARDIVLLKSRISTLGGAASVANGYREALQARNGIRVFAAQEAVNMRLDVARQIDMMNRQGMDEEQMHNDLVSAFERGVGTWRSVSPAGGY
jgi:hypothetical protein